MNYSNVLTLILLIIRYLFQFITNHCEYKIPDELNVEINNEKQMNKPFGDIDAFSMSTNLDLKGINTLIKKINPTQEINLSGYFLSLAESKGDIYIASTFESELVTSELYSKFIGIQLNEIIKKRTNSQQNINLFEECILENCHTVGEAFVNSIISKKDLLKILADADKFRGWLSTVEEDKNIISEYHKAVVKESKLDKLPGKTVRFAIFQGIGLGVDLLGANGLGTAAMVGINVLDSFFLDKILKGWKPNQFIDNKLIPLVRK